MTADARWPTGKCTAASAFAEDFICWPGSSIAMIAIGSGLTVQELPDASLAHRATAVALE